MRRSHPPRPEPTGRPPERALLDLLGLAARARAVAFGTDSTRQAVRDGDARCVVIAADISPTQLQKLLPLVQARGVPCFSVLTRDEIGAAVGRASVSAVGFTQESFARRAAELAAAIPSPQD
ncbi:MAG: ribosomal protein [Gemmatimonadetes bacterium]|nr:ribosomal protein [Gemmatimonadota bacterium]